MDRICENIVARTYPIGVGGGIGSVTLCWSGLLCVECDIARLASGPEPEDRTEPNVSVDCFGTIYCPECAWEGAQYGDEYHAGNDQIEQACQFCPKKWDPLFCGWEAP